MDIITIDAQITPDRRLTGYELPDDVPAGRVKLIIQPADDDHNATQRPLTRESVRVRLLAAGRLSTARHALDGAVQLSDDESKRLARLFADETQSVLDLVNEDRGPKG